MSGADSSAGGSAALAGRARQWRRPGTGWLALFAVTVFVSSSLLFLVQPMFAKMVLPLLGGTPATWITCLLFFQAALLAGYAYAHWSTRWLGSRHQSLVHAALIVLGLLVLPIAVPPAWRPPSATDPLGWLLVLLLVSVGLPFFLVASTAPLLQRWFAGTRHAVAHDPYSLYRFSNLGSMLALLAYPLVVEPRFSLADQASLWTAGYVGLVALTAACALAPWRAPLTATVDRRDDGATWTAGPTEPAAKGALGAARRARWVALAFVPSSFMLAVTTHVTTDIAAVPLLWVIPLALYLLSFVVVFSPPPWSRLDLAVPAQSYLVLNLVLLIVLDVTGPVLLVIAVNLLAFFLSALVCHGRLAEDRPPHEHLTEFYLWVALGGVVGGVFNAVVAPLVFNAIVEYPLAIVLACLLRPRDPTAEDTSGDRRLDLLVPLGVGVVAAASGWLARIADLGPVAAAAVAAGPAVLLCAALTRRPVRFGLAVGAVLAANALAVGVAHDTLYAGRTFFGVLRVDRDRDYQLHTLVHGNTIHGAQSTDPRRRLEPLSYYHPDGPAGQAFRVLSSPTSASDVAVIGLGTGSLACYGRAGQHWTFYEIDPAVERIARDPKLFTYLRDCPPVSDVVVGDARLSLADAPGRHFGAIVVDAFNSDSIPVHLLTRQALGLYLDRLAEGGIIAMNISNRYLDLRGVVGDLARDLRLAALVREDVSVTAAGARAGKSNSLWAVLARHPGDLTPLAGDAAWVPLPVRDSQAWTDDFSDIAGAFRRS